MPIATMYDTPQSVDGRYGTKAALVRRVSALWYAVYLAWWFCMFLVYKGLGTWPQLEAVPPTKRLLATSSPHFRDQRLLRLTCRGVSSYPMGKALAVSLKACHRRQARKLDHEFFLSQPPPSAVCLRQRRWKCLQAVADERLCLGVAKSPTWLLLPGNERLLTRLFPRCLDIRRRERFGETILREVV